MATRWAKDMVRMHKGTDLLFKNKFDEAEEVYLEGMRDNEDRHSLKTLDEPDDGEHDLRGAFALQYALSAVIKGLASLSNDQLVDAMICEADQTTCRARTGRAVGKMLVARSRAKRALNFAMSNKRRPARQRGASDLGDRKWPDSTMRTTTTAAMIATTSLRLVPVHY